MLPIKHTRTYGAVSETADTPIVRLVEPMRGLTAVLTSLDYAEPDEGHEITVLKPLGVNRVAMSADGGDTELVLGDLDESTPLDVGYVVIELDDGSFQLNTADSWDSPELTLDDVLDGDVSPGRRVWFFGEPADHVADGLFIPEADTRAVIEETVAGLYSAGQVFAPLLIHSDNPTAAGTLHRASVAYCDFGRQ